MRHASFSLPGTSKNRRERSECKADPAQDPRHIPAIGEGPSTAQRRNRTARRVIGGAVRALAAPWPWLGLSGCLFLLLVVG